MSALRVYVSGPLTSSGSFNGNTRRAIDVAERLRRGGLVPFVPHLFGTWELLYPGTTYDQWMALDLAWLDACDVLVRLSGESRGADIEVKHALAHGIPVFYEDEHHGPGTCREVSLLISKAAAGDIKPRNRTGGSLAAVQREMPAWQAYNFPGRPAYQPLLGMVEEIGELAHAWLKRAQGIRGTSEEHTAAIEDAIVDALVYSVDLACEEHIDLDVAMAKVWAKVRARDWRKFPKHGVAPDIALAKLREKRAALDREILDLAMSTGREGPNTDHDEYAPTKEDLACAYESGAHFHEDR